ncbi:MAG: GIY-YIG nuclease family protein [Planctomycetota bacterium]|jgi:predicted GIY-YIG superfamily endonuclease
MSSHWVYTLHFDGTDYHGYTSQLRRRLKEHRSRCRNGDNHVLQEIYAEQGLWKSATFRQFETKEEALAEERRLIALGGSLNS